MALTNSSLDEDQTLGLGNSAFPTNSGIGVSTPETTSVYPSPDLISEPPGTPGIGVAAPQAPQAEEPSRFDRVIHNLVALGTGGLTYDEAKDAREQKKKHAQLEELKGTVTALEHGISMRQGMTGDDAAAFDEAYGNKLEAISPGMKQTFMALSKKPDLLTQFQGYAQYLPEPTRIMMQSNPREFLKYAGTADGQKVLVDAKDRFDMRLASKKVQTAMLGLKEYMPPDEYKKIAEDGVITASDVLGAQKYVPDAAKLNDNEIAAIQRNDKVFWQGLGVLHGTAEQDVLKDRAKKYGKGEKQPEHLDVDGKKYEWDPEKKLSGPRLGRDPRYAELGQGASSAEGAKRVQDIELKLSDDYRQDTKQFRPLRASFDSATDYMAHRSEDKTSAGDAALAFAYAKMRDPNDRLAVSETRDLAKLGNIFERIGVNISGVLDKGETLPDRVAKQMYDEIRRRFSDLNKAQTQIEGEYKNKVKAYGGDHTRVVRPLALPDEQVNPKRRGSDQPKPEGGGEVRKKVGGVNYVKKDGQWYEERP